MAPLNEIFTSTTAAPPSFTPQTSASYVHFTSSTVNPRAPPSTTRSIATTIGAINGAASENLIIDDSQGRNNLGSFDNTINQFTTTGDTISNILRREGLYAMAKYLRQSGLDTVLNETGEIILNLHRSYRSL